MIICINKSVIILKQFLLLLIPNIDSTNFVICFLQILEMFLKHYTKHFQKLTKFVIIFVRSIQISCGLNTKVSKLHFIQNIFYQK